MNRTQKGSHNCGSSNVSSLHTGHFVQVTMHMLQIQIWKKFHQFQNVPQLTVSQIQLRIEIFSTLYEVITISANSTGRTSTIELKNFPNFFQFVTIFSCNGIETMLLPARSFNFVVTVLIIMMMAVGVFCIATKIFVMVKVNVVFFFFSFSQTIAIFQFFVMTGNKISSSRHVVLFKFQMKLGSFLFRVCQCPNRVKFC